MKLIALATLTLLAVQAKALDCQNLAGEYVYANDPGHSVAITQQDCAITVTNTTVGGQTGTPIYYSGDGKWIDDGNADGIALSHMSIAKASEYITKTKMVDQSGELLLTEIYKLKSDGNIVKNSTAKFGGDTTAAAFQLIRTN